MQRRDRWTNFTDFVRANPNTSNGSCDFAIGRK
jgi:hypothetical protein